MQQFLALITVLTDPGGGAPPLGIWGPTDPRPTPPIHMPPGAGGGGGGDLGIWGPTDPRPTPPIAWPPLGMWGPNDPRPTNPIVIPPEAPPGEQPPTGPLGKMSWHTVWTEDHGWAVIGVAAGEHVTPSTPKGK